MKKPSAETQLRHLKRDSKRLEVSLQEATRMRDAYRARATTAEQEVAEWKRRFDDLLRLKPQAPSFPSGLEERVKAMVGGAHDTSLYINAIKLVRNETNMSLKAAKDYVDGLKPVAA